MKALIAALVLTSTVAMANGTKDEKTTPPPAAPHEAVKPAEPAAAPAEGTAAPAAKAKKTKKNEEKKK